MIKGVKKLVLEINETNNSFFEKAIFFVKPEYSGMSEGKLREKAFTEMNGICSLPRLKKVNTHTKKHIWVKLGWFFSGVVAGILFCTLF